MQSDNIFIIHPPAIDNQSIPANGLIFLFGSILAIVIIAMVLSSIIDFLIVSFIKKEDKEIKRKEEFKSYLKLLPIFLVPLVMIIFSALLLNFKISYMTSGMGEKIYSSSDFARIANYGAFIAIFSFIMLIIGVIRLIRKKGSSNDIKSKKTTIIWVVLFVIMTILYSWSSIQMMLASK